MMSSESGRNSFQRARPGASSSGQPFPAGRRLLETDGLPHGKKSRRRRDPPLLVLQQGPERRPQAHCGPDGLHLRRVRRGLQRHHRRRQQVRGARRRPDLPAGPAGNQEVPRRVRHRPGTDQEEAGRRGLQPLQAHRDPEAGAQPQRHRAHQVEHPADRADRHRQDAARADAGEAPLGPLHHRRRDDADRGRVRGRGRREHHPQAAAGRGRRHREVPAGDHLHRRSRQDLPQGREPVDHPRRVGRGRAAGAAEDSGRHGRERAAAGRTQAPAPGVLPGRYDQHPVHLRRRVRRPRQADRPAHRARRRSASRPT